MVEFFQSDEYELLIEVLLSDDVPTTPENITAIRIAVGDVVHEYPKGKLSFINGCWHFPLTAEETDRMCGVKKWQAEILKDGARIHTQQQEVKAIETHILLRGEWNA